jgi:hypothetical protein
MFESQFQFLAEESRHRQNKSEKAMTSHERDIRIRACDDYITRQVGDAHLGPSTSFPSHIP